MIRFDRNVVRCWATLGVVAALAFAPVAVLRADSIQEPPKMTPIALNLPAAPPKGALVLFSGKPEEMHDLWLKRYTTEPAGWTIKDGVATPNKSDIVTKQEFGDAYLHVEFKCPKGEGGNAGVGLQGRYEIQILDSFGKEPESHGAGALYSQKAPLVNASKPAGEWEAYDIFFRAPRFNDKGEVTEKPRATVIHNGVIIQNNEEFTGMTGINYDQYKEMTKTGPLILQGDHDVVQFRNVWIVPM